MALGVERLEISAFKLDLNGSWISRTMKEAENNNLLLYNPEINRVWKPSEESTAEFAIDFWE